jgi:hypothetical protein
MTSKGRSGREREEPTDEGLKDEKNVIKLRTRNEERETGRRETRNKKQETRNTRPEDE